MTNREQKIELIRKALEEIKRAGKEGFNQGSVCYDIAAYVAREAGFDFGSDSECVDTYHIRFESFMNGLGFTDYEIQQLQYKVREELFNTSDDLPDDWFELLTEDVERIINEDIED